MVDGARHGLNLFAVCCGDSSKARKGTAGSQALRLLTPCDPTWAATRVKKAIRGKRRKFREAGVLEPIIEQALDRGLLRRREQLSSGPGAPANCVELVELVAIPSSVLRGSGMPGGIAVPVSVFGGSAECVNSDTDTSTTGNTDTQDIA